MQTIEHKGRKVHLDDEGYLLNIDDWSEDVACAIAEREGIEELSKDRMDIIRFVREHYKKFNFFPILNAVCKNVHQPKDCINERFIDPMKAWRIAGLPKPDDMVVNLLVHGQTPT